MDGKECPALYFDPLIIVGGDRQKDDPREPNYSARCDEHHYLPGKEYTFLFLKPMGEEAARSNTKPLEKELAALSKGIEDSQLHRHLSEKQLQDEVREVTLNALKVPCLAEKALIYLFAEENLLTKKQILDFIVSLNLDRDYVEKRLTDNRRDLA